MLVFIVFHQITKEKQYAPGMSEQERLLEIICSKHFEGGLGRLGPTKPNPVPAIFDFPKHFQRKERQDPVKRRLKNTSTTNRIQKASKPWPIEV